MDFFIIIVILSHSPEIVNNPAAKCLQAGIRNAPLAYTIRKNRFP